MDSAGDADDDDVQLSAHALAALQEFYSEQAAMQEQMVKMQQGEAEAAMPQEDWQLSQFWYSEETATRLAKEALEVAGDNGRIACISCPTMYKKLRELKPDTCQAVILEYDNRFKIFGNDFIFYDYNNPLDLPEDYQSAFDIVVADPPFLSEECLTKTSQTVKYMAKDKIILCTGAIMEEKANELLNTRVCSYLPKHTRNLANEFRCYANYKTLHLES